VPVDDQRDRHDGDREHGGCQQSADGDISQYLRSIGRIEKATVQGLAYVGRGDVKYGTEKQRRNAEPRGRADGQNDAEFEQRRGVARKPVERVIKGGRLPEAITP